MLLLFYYHIKLSFQLYYDIFVILALNLPKDEFLKDF